MGAPSDPPEIVFRSADRRAGADAALVLEAIGLRPALHDLGRDWIVVVASHEADRAHAEIAAWLAENPPRKEPPVRMPVASGWPGVILYVVLMLAVALAVGNYGLGRDWLAAGRIDGAAMQAGQWWRAAPALTLHAGPEHLAANLFFGAVFGGVAGRYLGSGIAWLLILAAGSAGNVVNVLVMGAQHRSIGASTAVFAALGLLGALGWSGRRGSLQGRIHRWGPIIAAVALLAYTGAGGERTDIGAHVWGFVAGLGAGWMVAQLPREGLQRRGLQLASGLAALAALALAWWLALDGDIAKMAF